MNMERIPEISSCVSHERKSPIQVLFYKGSVCSDLGVNDKNARPCTEALLLSFLKFESFEFKFADFISLSASTASRSAFSVALTNTRLCVGPYREDAVVKYGSVFINLGDGYNTTTGVFVAPRSGVYNLALTVYSDSGAPGARLAACVRLRLNGRTLAAPSENNFQDEEDSASVVIAVQLRAGDAVDVALPAGCFLCDDISHYNTFTGFLLYATD